MSATKKTDAAAATVHVGTWEKNHRYYTAFPKKTQAPASDYELDSYGAPRNVRHMTKDFFERKWMHCEL